MTRVNCDRIPDLVADVLGGEATASALDALEHHRAACAACATVIDGIQRTLAEIRRLDVPEPPATYWAGFLPELRSRIDREEHHRRVGLREWLVPALAAAALTWLVLAGVRTVPGPGRPLDPRSAAGEAALADAELPSAVPAAVALSFVESLDVVEPVDGALWALPADAFEAIDAAGATTGDLFAFTDYEFDPEAGALLDEIAHELEG